MSKHDCKNEAHVIEETIDNLLKYVNLSYCNKGYKLQMELKRL